MTGPHRIETLEAENLDLKNEADVLRAELDMMSFRAETYATFMGEFIALSAAPYHQNPDKAPLLLKFKTNDVAQLIEADRVYLRQINSQLKDAPPPDQSKYSSLEELRADFRANSARSKNFLATDTDAEIAEKLFGL